MNTFFNKNYKFFITVFITILCFMVTLISVGFGALNKKLNISGEIDYDEHNNILYNVLKRAAKQGVYAKEFTGEHDDSYSTNGNMEIYYWNATNRDNGTAIKDKWNVLFAGFCWNMYRTTDTGGVKLIYSGVPSSGKCNNTGASQAIGNSVWNPSYSSLADAGYMYNKRYSGRHTGEQIFSIYRYQSMTSSSNYYYGTGVTYDSSTRKYTLTGIQQASWSSIYESSAGLYTCVSSTQYSCSSVNYIVRPFASSFYGFRLSNGNLLDYYTGNIVFGSSYTESNGTYTLVDTSSIAKLDWYNEYSSFNNYYTCGNSSVSCSKLYRATSVYSDYFTYNSTNNNYMYSSSFTYDSSTQKYTLDSTNSFFVWDLASSSNSPNGKYSCLNSSGVCETLDYVFLVETNYYKVWYMSLENGKSINDVINEMLYNDDVNTTNSTIKTRIDTWYSDNMTSYTNKLEDTIFCNGRSVKNWQGSAWFGFDKNIYCQKETDKFSVSNSKAKLTYPVGLATSAEMELLGTYARDTGSDYWLLNPDYYYCADAYSVADMQISSITPSGYLSGRPSRYYSDNVGVRPVVSLKPGTLYSSGDGSKDNPYIVN